MQPRSGSQTTETLTELWPRLTPLQRKLLLLRALYFYVLAAWPRLVVPAIVTQFLLLGFLPRNPYSVALAWLISLISLITFTAHYAQRHRSPRPD